MTNRIDERFNKLKSEAKKGFIPFITAGDPDLNATVELVNAMANAGADIIELGVPYSEPVADGPVIQAATQRALEKGVTLRKIINTVKQIRENGTSVPIVLMSYYNPILQYGLEKFAQDAKDAGVDGIIVPDLPIEESKPLFDELKLKDIHLIPLVAPTTTDARLRKIAARAGGFIYCVSVTGVTGEREKIDEELSELTARIRSASKLPVAVGFGVSKPEQAFHIAKHCDAVIVGSAVVKIIEQNPETAVEKVAEAVKAFKTAIGKTCNCFFENY